MNRKVILGLVLLILGLIRLYMIYSTKNSVNPTLVEIGCGMWISIGVYLVVKGVTEKPQ